MDPLFQVVHNGNRELAVKSGPYRPIIDFPQSIIGLIETDLNNRHNCLSFTY